MKKERRKAIIEILGVPRVSAMTGISKGTLTQITRGKLSGYRQRQYDPALDELIPAIRADADMALNAATVAATFAKGVYETTRLDSETVSEAEKLKRIELMSVKAKKRLTRYVQRLKDMPT